MPPKPTIPRLADLDADVLADEVCDKLCRFAEVVLAGTSHEPLQPKGAIVKRMMPLHSIVTRLVTFAQTGKGTGVYALDRFVAIYYGSPATGSAWKPIGEEDSIATVVLAAQARVDLAKGVAVEHRALAALAGVHTSRIRQLSGGKNPTLPRAVERGRLEAAPARRWLAAQKVPGFEAPPPPAAKRKSRSR